MDIVDETRKRRRRGTAPLPDPAKPFAEQDPCVLLAMCIFGEARGECDEGKVAVGCVVRNRVNCQGAYGIGFTGVILKPWQFSSFNANDPNRHKLLEPLEYESEAVWNACFAAAAAVFQDEVDDLTEGAVFYFSPPCCEPPPVWGDVTPTVKIGDLNFYRLEA